MQEIDWIYIVHYKPLISRKTYLIQKFAQLGISNYTFFEEYSRDTTPKEVMDSYFKLNNLTPAQICITIAHIEIYREVIENGYRSVLIFEDDARLEDTFVEQFSTYMECVPSDYDMLFLNNGCNLHAKGITSHTIWYKEYSTRTCCAYIITRATCEKLVGTIIPFTKAIDHELNTQITLHSLNVYWCEPTLVSDGSGHCYSSSYTYY